MVGEIGYLLMELVEGVAYDPPAPPDPPGVTWFSLGCGVFVLELNPLPGGLALELQVTELAGAVYAAWLTDDGKMLRAWRAARA